MTGRPTDLWPILHAVSPHPGHFGELMLFERLARARDVEWRGTDNAGKPAVMHGRPGGDEIILDGLDRDPAGRWASSGNRPCHDLGWGGVS